MQLCVCFNSTQSKNYTCTKVLWNKVVKQIHTVYEIEVRTRLVKFRRGEKNFRAERIAQKCSIKEMIVVKMIKTKTLMHRSVDMSDKMTCCRVSLFI